MISNKKAAASNSAASVGGKTARACDSCVKKRARWYCAAEDTFLCQTCDSSVHSANPLARRHERVKLKTASSSSSKISMQDSCHESSVSAWHRGFTRKPRTPRQGKSAVPRNKFPLVPEVGADDMSNEENEEDHVLYRVPIFDSFVAELTVANGESTPIFDLPSDMELADFAADMDSLLERGLDDHECFGMLGLGLKDYDEKEASTTEEGGNGIVKVEDDEDGSMACQYETMELNLRREPFVLNFEDYDDHTSPASCGEDEEEEEEDVKLGVRKTSGKEHKSCNKRKMILRLDYDDVISKWDSKGSPFAFGDRPDVNSDCLPDFMVNASEAELLNYPYGDLKGVIGLHPATIDGGREARVTRYREKRRTRVFSKKIRYEVRKLNAEKRPRMKGRFVKRVTFGTTESTCPMLIA